LCHSPVEPYALTGDAYAPAGGGPCCTNCRDCASTDEYISGLVCPLAASDEGAPIYGDSPYCRMLELPWSVYDCGNGVTSSARSTRGSVPPPSTRPTTWSGSKLPSNSSLRTRFRMQKNRSAKIVMAATPPTAAPTMTPVWESLLLLVPELMEVVKISGMEVVT